MENSENPDSRRRYRRTPRQTRSVQRVERILASATALIGEHGVSGLKMTEIAVHAGVPIGSVYQYFPDRQAIVKALFDRLMVDIHLRMMTGFENVTSFSDAAERLCTIMDWLYAHFRRRPEDFEIWVSPQTDRDLFALRLSDDIVVSHMFHDAIRHLLPQDARAGAEARSLLLCHLIAAAIRLAVSSKEETGQRLLEEWKQMVRVISFP